MLETRTKHKLAEDKVLLMAITLDNGTRIERPNAEEGQLGLQLAVGLHFSVGFGVKGAMQCGWSLLIYTMVLRSEDLKVLKPTKLRPVVFHWKDMSALGNWLFVGGRLAIES